MRDKISTSNMPEVLYLLDRNHQVVDVGMLMTWPYGVEELCVTLEGEGIDLDHRNFILHGGCTLTRLSVAFDAVMANIWIQEEHPCSGW